MNQLTYEVITRPGLDPATAEGKPPLPPLTHEVEESDGLRIERNVAIPMSDGVRIYADVYQPAGTTTGLPVLLAWGPYGKHNQKDMLWPTAGIEPGWMSKLTGFEAPDPAYWCAHGYAVVYVDPRGMWHSEGEGVHNGPQEAEDVFDAIEWLGAREWSNGRVGMLGVSYLAGIQYIAAAMRPPALKAISPWECFSDWYREFCHHGGIPETGFIPRASRNMRYSLTRTEDTHANVLANPLMAPYYRDRYPDLTQITVPAYVVASWSDHGLHTRGTLEAYRLMSSNEKWLEVHGQKKWRYFYDPSNVERQRVFFDHYLLDRGAGPVDWPKVRLEVHDTAERYGLREDLPWPIPEDRAVRLHADLQTRTLGESAPVAAASATFDPMVGSLDLEHVFAAPTDVVGPMRLRLWLQADDAEDADIFVAVRKFAADGTERRFAFNALFEDGPVALGWLRASHQELDTEKSSELQPVHLHEGEEPLVPGEPRALDVEIWPSGTFFDAGEKLVVTIQGRDFVDREVNLNSPVIMHQDLRNRGTWTVHSGPGRESYLSLARFTPQTR
ncbi:CocE/NonD family hydrolase [Arthrobacter ginkgonis]|uniref:CocE/NonD family hydrolase n=1 Tax=Arthrobacter ginkgonis TaxID=1630594 RepID=A0ABP7C4A5_9MICC